MTDRLENFRAGYAGLEERVHIALRVQLGDVQRLHAQRDEALSFLDAAEQHREVFPAGEYPVLYSNICAIVASLEMACTTSSDPCADDIAVVRHRATGKRGRPRVDIDHNYLARALTLAGPSGIASILGCSSRTVRRSALKQGLAKPGDAVYTKQPRADGSHVKKYNPLAATPASTRTRMSDHDLDGEMFTILQLFPHFGRSMITGHLRAKSFHVTRKQIRASYLRIHGAPVTFGSGRIGRRKYSVPGVNSLWHHDGQHGLIRWKLVTHGFIDGKSRFVTGMRVSNNNLGATVLEIFLRATATHGWPSRVRGDHGVENTLVAEAMEAQQGYRRGSYIYGRSVHNTRIERLWLDWTQGVGLKWYDFFMSLEHNYGLKHDNPAHIWLVHHLFLDALNQDAEDWVSAWNSHVIQIRGEPNRSPVEMFVFGMTRDGARGLEATENASEPEAEDMTPEELAGYGVDYEAQGNPRLMDHLLEHNPQEWENENPFLAGSAPDKFTTVICDPPGCPLSLAQRDRLDLFLLQRVDATSRDMNVRKLIWIEALRICQELTSA